MSPFRPLFVDAEEAIDQAEMSPRRTMRRLRHYQTWLRLEFDSLWREWHGDWPRRKAI